MNKVIFLFACIILLLFLNFYKFENKSVGAVGDIKYSILEPEKFIKENGSGWVLMDDKIPLQNSDLKNRYGITELPDARGMFIRGLNLKRSDSKMDPFVKENNNRERLPGDYQPDDLIRHKHDMNYPLGRIDDWKSQSWGGVDNQLLVASPGGTHHETIEFGGNETRPKNISLYIYIKLNE